jgi:four helix bundle protein
MWEKAQELTVELLRFTKNLPSDRTTNVLVQQAVRSVTAIGANIAEGHGRFAAGAYRNHLSIARGSAAETLSWLDTFRLLDLIDEELEMRLVGLCDEVMRMISAKMIDLDKETGRSGAFRGERVAYDAT